MRLVLAVGVVALLAGCGNEYHPEYHPVTTTTYTQAVGTPARVVVPAQGEAGQTVLVAPAGGPTASFPPPPQPPVPPEGWPN